MNFLDILIAVPLGYLIFKGYKRGLIFELSSLIGIVFGSIVAVRMAHLFLELLGFEGDSALLIAFFILFVGVVVFALFLGKLIERFVKLIHVGFMNNLAGAVFGLAKGVCIVGVLLYFIAIIDLNDVFLKKEIRQTSVLYKPVEKAGSYLVGRIDCYLDERRKEVEC